MGAKSDESTWEAVRKLPMGQRVHVTDANGHAWAGTVIPSHELSGDRVLTLKLASGYNVGVRVGPGSTYELLGPTPVARDEGAVGTGPRATPPPGRGWVALLTTGGTIASRVDYETGGVRPAKGESEIFEVLPELGSDGTVRIVPVFDRMSEDLAPADWVTIAERTVAAFRDGAQGVVIAHGTDTLGFTAAALGFLLEDLPGPVVIVGAQRSPDRPSSDGPSNLTAALAVARDRRLGEVVAVMHAGLSDDRFAVHRGVWVRKMHSTRRDAFESRNGPALGVVAGGTLELTGPVRAPAAGPPRLDGPIDPRAGLLYSFPGLTTDRARAFAAGLRGVVLAGTGLGHVSEALLPWIREATAHGQVVAMTTQCLAGTTDPFVYATGRALRAAGVLYLGDLLPETAYAKMVWALGHAADPDGVKRRLLADRAGEFVDRHQPEAPA